MTIDPGQISSKIAACPGLPVDHGGPVFAAPWQAQIFALIVALHERGVLPGGYSPPGLTPPNPRAPLDEQGPDFYYRHWLQAAEELLHRLDLLDAAELMLRTEEITEAAHHHK
jgi:hypothetical protein